MKEIALKSEKYRKIAEKVINAVEEVRFIKETGIKVAYLESDRRKVEGTKVVYADCRKVPDLYYVFCKCDFIITVYEPNVEELSDNQLKILLLHELMHIGIDDQTQEVKFVLNPHDYEEFKYISDRYGFDWSEPGADVPDITANCGK